MKDEHPIYLSVSITPLKPVPPHQDGEVWQYRGHAVATRAGVEYVTAEVRRGAGFEGVGNSVVRMALQRLADKEKSSPMSDDPRKRQEEPPEGGEAWHVRMFHNRVRRYLRCVTLDAPRPILDNEGKLIRKSIGEMDNDTLVKAICSLELEEETQDREEDEDNDST